MRIIRWATVLILFTLVLRHLGRHSAPVGAGRVPIRIARSSHHKHTIVYDPNEPGTPVAVTDDAPSAAETPAPAAPNDPADQAKPAAAKPAKRKGRKFENPSTWKGCINRLDKHNGADWCSTQTAKCDKQLFKNECAKACQQCSDPNDPNVPPVPATAQHNFSGTGYFLAFMCSTFTCDDRHTNTFLGPNNQFKSFRHAVTIARQLNRTIVIPQFHSHHLDVSSSHGPHWWNFSDTFDKEVFAQHVPSVTVQDFFEKVLPNDHTLDLVLASAIDWPTKIMPLKAFSRFGVKAKKIEYGTSTTWSHVREVTVSGPPQQKGY